LNGGSLPPEGDPRVPSDDRRPDRPRPRPHRLDSVQRSKPLALKRSVLVDKRRVKGSSGAIR
jgi:hypothetical protein